MSSLNILFHEILLTPLNQGVGLCPALYDPTVWGVPQPRDVPYLKPQHHNPGTQQHGVGATAACLVCNHAGSICRSEATNSTIELSGSALQSALQYLPTPGHPGLLQQLGSLQQALHSPQPGVEMVVTQGARDGLCRALEMLVSPGTLAIFRTLLNLCCTQGRAC